VKVPLYHSSITSRRQHCRREVGQKGLHESPDSAGPFVLVFRFCLVFVFFVIWLLGASAGPLRQEFSDIQYLKEMDRDIDTKERDAGT
jgi:hypothetical protein